MIKNSIDEVFEVKYIDFQEKISRVKNTFGIYVFFKDDEVLYIGKSIHMVWRLKQHFQWATHLIFHYHMNAIGIKYCDSEEAALSLEDDFIKRFKPKLNNNYQANGVYRKAFSVPLSQEQDDFLSRFSEVCQAPQTEIARKALDRLINNPDFQQEIMNYYEEKRQTPFNYSGSYPALNNK